VGGKAAAEFMSLSQRVDNSKLKTAGFVLKHPRFTDEIDSVMEQIVQARNETRLMNAPVRATDRSAH
jgi:hypothetical protein